MRVANGLPKQKYKLDSLNVRVGIDGFNPFPTFYFLIELKIFIVTIMIFAFPERAI
jgi:hypothetical protein